MKRLFKSLMLVSAVVVIGTPLFTNTAVAAEENHNKITSISARTSTFEVNASGVRLRKSPGTSASIVRTLQKGEYVSGGREFATKDGYTWTAVICQRDGASGWVAEKYLTEIG